MGKKSSKDKSQWPSSSSSSSSSPSSVTAPTPDTSSLDDPTKISQDQLQGLAKEAIKKFKTINSNGGN